MMLRYGGIGLVVALGMLALGSVGYLLGLLLATRRRRAAVPVLPSWPSVAVVIPAHDEALVIGATLASLEAQRYPIDAFERIVVADNCTDNTVALAAATGATVWERTDPDLRGKGYALEWAMERLLARATPPDAVVIVDADTLADPEFLPRLIAPLFAGVGPAAWPQHRRALQGRYGVLNAAASWRAALMSGAFELVNHIKPLGRAALGFSVGLKGNGMAFTRAVLEAAPWRGQSITEDIDYGLDLLLHHGLVVGYVPDAVVKAQMPNEATAATSQRNRWERGRYRLLRERVPGLLQGALHRGDLRLLDAALDLLVPPLAELAALLALWSVVTATVVGLHGLPPWALLAPVLGWLGLTAYILGGLRCAGVGPEVYRALLRAPFYAIWKLALYLRQGGSGWVRTAREPLAPERQREDAA